MKKKIIFIIPILVIFLLVGCKLNNTPTSKVEEKISKYQKVDDSINMEELLNLLTDGDNINNNQKDEYEKILKKQISSLSYNIKDETQDGDEAIVKVEVTVKDFASSIKELNQEVNKDSIGVDSYHDERIKRLKNTKDKVTYTILFEVIKDENGNFRVNELDSDSIRKILGIY